MKKGFTLIELLVVISIIGLLSSVVLASLNSARAKARDAQRRAELKEVAKALELYHDKYETYLVANSGYTDANTPPIGYGWLTYDYDGSGPVRSVTHGLVEAGYLGGDFTDPLWGIQTYLVGATKDNYTLWARLENPGPGDTNNCVLNWYSNQYSTNYCIGN